ncbi:MAG: hypothetical protein FWD09_05130, partial [Lentimicrobiaceae bacterium]|nr:hypothetical protein [Lentimicrobiaceae bacterium]
MKSKFLFFKRSFSFFCLFLLFFWGGAFFTTKAQPRLVWSDEPNKAPRQITEPMVIMGDVDTLYINAKLEDVDMENVRVEIVLPIGFEFAGPNADGTGTPTRNSMLADQPELTPRARFSSANPTITTVNVAGVGDCRKATINYIGGSPGTADNALRVGDSLVMKVMIRATCNANPATPGIYDVYILCSNYGVYLGYRRDANARVLNPVLRLIPEGGRTTIFDSIYDVQKITLNINAESGYSNSTLITLGPYNSSIIALDSFKLDGVLLPVIAGNGTANTNPGVRWRYAAGNASQYVYIQLPQSLLEGRIDATDRKLTFNASTNLGCNREIPTAIRSSLGTTLATPGGTISATTYCTEWTTAILELQVSSDGDIPTYSTSTNVAHLRTISRFDPDPAVVDVPPDPHSNNINYYCWDGSENYCSFVFTNGNNQPTASFNFRTGITTVGGDGLDNDLSHCAYIDTSQVYFRVTVRNAANTADSIVIPVEKIPGSLVSGIASYIFPTNSTLYDPILHGKAVYAIISLPISNSRQLPAGAKIEVEYVSRGNPAWNLASNRDRTTFQSTSPTNNHFTLRHQNITSGNSCNHTIQWASDANTYSFSKPRFYAPAQEKMTVRPGVTYTYSNKANTGSNNTTATDNPTGSFPTGPRYAEFFIKIPAWLDLDIPAGENVNAAMYFVNETTGVPIALSAANTDTGIYHGLTDGYKLYSVKYFNNITGLLNVQLKPGPCPPDECFIVDTVQIWADWISGDLSDCRARFNKTTKTHSLVELNCLEPAFVTDTLGVYRYTRGLKDSNNNHAPDDGSPALDNEMSHWHFSQGDTGYYFLQGVVSGTPTTYYDTLVSILRYETGGALAATRQYFWGSNGHTVPFVEEATIEIVRWEAGARNVITLPLKVMPLAASVDSIVVYYDGKTIDNRLQGGDSCYMRVPFYCRLGVGSDNTNFAIRGSIFAKTYGILTTPLVDCKPEDSYDPSKNIKMAFADLALLRASSSPEFYFGNVCAQNQPGTYTRNSYAGDEPPAWNYEVRHRHKLDSIVIVAPAGYYVENDNIIIRPYLFPNTNTSIPNSLVVKPDKVVENYTTHAVTYTVYLAPYLDYDFDESDPDYTYESSTGRILYQGVPTGKYMFGDGASGAYYYFESLVATPASGSSSITATMYYTNFLGQRQSYAAMAANLIYTGPALHLGSLVSSVQVASQLLSLSSVSVQNYSNSTVLEDTWLYLKGNVENAYLVRGSDTIWGEGLDNCWLPVGDMAPSQILNYSLFFSYKEKAHCANDTLALYTVFNSLDDPDFSTYIKNTIDDVPRCFRGRHQYTILDVMTPKVRVAGYINLDIPNPNPALDGYLHYMHLYTVDYVINGRVSQGALSEPYVVITVPKGQVYVDTTAFGVAQFEYPQGSGFQPIPQAILDRLTASIGEDSDDWEITRTDTIWLKDLLEVDEIMLPGWAADHALFPDADRVVNIRIPFVPTCETDMTGLRFHGNFFGKKACGDPAEDNGMLYSTGSIYTDVFTDYTFEVNLTNVMFSTKSAFTPDKLYDTLRVEFKKLTGLDEHINAADYIRLTLPADLVVDGDIICEEFGGFIVAINDVSPVDPFGYVNYELFMPIDELNALLAPPLPDNKSDSTFIYYIPVKYTPPATYDCSKPRREVTCQVVTHENFSSECGAMPISIGSGVVLLLLLNADTEDYRACLNMPLTLSFACTGVTPVWCSDETGSTASELGIGTYTYTPKIQKDTTFYIHAFYDLGNYMGQEDDFGFVPVIIRMFPEVVAKFSATEVCPGDTTIFTNLSTVGGVASEKYSNTQQWYWYRNGELFDTIKNPRLPSNNVPLYNPSNSTPLSNGDLITLKVVSTDGCERDTTIAVVVYTPPTPTISGEATGFCFKDSIVYRTEPGYSNYQWTVERGTALTALAGTDSIEVRWDSISAFFPNRGIVKVSYSDANNCTVETSYDITVPPPPPPPVITGLDSVCVNTEVTYNAPAGTIHRYEWVVTGTTGERVVTGGGTLISPSVSVKWMEAGNYLITLDVERSGCVSDSIGKLPILVTGPPRPTITGDATPFCIDATTTHTYTTQPGWENYNWQITGGNIINGAGTNEVEVEWNTWGTGKLAVSYEDAEGCENYILDTLRIDILETKITGIAPDTLISKCYDTGNFPPLNITTLGNNLSYQWYRNTTNSTTTPTPVAVGENSATFSPPSNVNVGEYYFFCVITGDCGKDTSDFSGKHTIKPALEITHPSVSSRALCYGVGSFPQLSITATGVNLEYQWYINTTNDNTGGTALSGANSSSYSPPNDSTPGTYYYYVVVTSDCGPLTSNVSGEHVIKPTTTITDPASTNPTPLCRNEADFPQLSITATGVGLSYQWYRNTALSTTTPAPVAVGGNSASYTPSSDLDPGDYYYYVVVTGDCGVETSDFSDKHTVKPGPSITAQTAAEPRTVCHNTDLFPQLSITAAGVGLTLSYQWYSNASPSTTGGTLITDSIGTTLTPPNNLTPGTYYYYCIVSSECGTAASHIWEHIIKPTTVITAPPSPALEILCFNTGNFPQLSVTATGYNLRYRWYTNGSASTSGATQTDSTGTTFTPSSNLPAGDYYYYVVVTGDCGVETSDFSGKHTVKPATKVMAHPDPAIPTALCYNTTNFPPLSVTATGDNLNYQWYINTSAAKTGGTLLTGATTAAYTPPSDSTAGDYYYYVVVTGDCGKDTSNVSGRHTIKPTTVITAHPNTGDDDKCYNTGNFNQLSVTATGAGLSYQWYRNTAVSTTTPPPVAVGGNSATYTPPSDLPAGDYYYYVVVTGDCGNVTSNFSGKYTIDVCKLIECDDTDKTATEDGCEVGYYTHLDNTWNLVPVAGVAFDSVKYILNNTTVIRGTGATLQGVQFTAGATTHVKGIAFFGLLTDTCEFNVVVQIAGIIATLTSSVDLGTICSGDNVYYSPTSATTGVTYGWMRVAMPGILPVANARVDDDEIDEVLINNTSSP